MKQFETGALRADAWFRGRALGVVVVMLGVVASAAGLRVLEWPLWRDGAYWLGSSPLMASADAYAWLAGAVETGRMSGWPMARVIAWLSGVSAQPPGLVAFWLPCLLAGIPGAVVAGVCAVKGRILAGLAGGLLATGSLGYLARTRLGYAETELFALAVVTAFAAVWAMAMTQLVRSKEGDGAWLASGWLPAAWGTAWLGVVAYPSAYPVLLAVALAGGLYALLAGQLAVALPLAITVVGSVWVLHFGFAGLVGALVLFAIVARRRELLTGWLAGLLGVLTVAAVIALEWEFLVHTAHRISAYAGLGLSPPVISDWVLPRVDDSIQETAHVGVAEWVQRVGTHWVFLVGGIGGLGLVLWRWPTLVTFLPLLGLGFASYWLGHRFAMYAAPALGLGLGLGLALLLERFVRSSVVCTSSQLVLAIMVSGVLVWHGLELRPDPSIERGQARALQALGNVEHDRGRVWTWWDTGYAAQFYAGLPTLADGGSAARQRIYMLGQVFGAHDPARAAGMMRFAGAERARAMDAAEDWRAATYDTRPLETLTDTPAAEVEALLDGLAQAPSAADIDRPDEFVVASWKTLRQAQWISYFGQWRLDKGEQGYGWITRLRPPVEFDEDRGLLHTGEGTVALISLDILEFDNHYRNRWPRQQGAHAVINNTNGEGVLLDTSLYQMMAVQMLIGDPQNFEEDFELVSDQSPAARVYRLR